MCGIAGFVGSLFSEEELRKYLSNACRALYRRGPDQQGFYIEPGIALGTSRLAIRDPAKGMQPMTRQGMTLVFNGELYNTKFLQDRLVKAGYLFETKSDTEIFLNAFLEFGPSVIAEHTGMFAFALWDSKLKTLYLGRDRWGEKPLYYMYGEEFFVFASEIKGLKPWPHLKWDINLEDIQIFLKNSYLTNPRTGWKNVFKLMQGSLLVWRQGRLTQKRYFTPVATIQRQKTSNNAEELFHLLHASVKNCLISDKPVGAFLSGGIDSSTVAYFLSRNVGNAPVFSLHWDDKAYSEENFAKKVAQTLKLTHHTVKCDSSFFVNHFDSIVRLYDEPFADESMVPTYCLARFAKQYVDVVLTGDGADEFFHGYERYFFRGGFKRYLQVFAATSSQLLKTICNPDFVNEEETSFLFYYFQAKPYLAEERLRSWVDINTYLTDDILMKVDRACMGVSLETRAPFLTPQVTDFALRCPIEQLIGNGSKGKEILRLAMKHHLPQVIIERKKMGFGVPLNRWFCSSLKDWMTERLLEGKLLETGWFSKKGIRNLIAKPSKHSRTILNLLVLEVWLREKISFSRPRSGVQNFSE